jgi:cell division protein FtsW (lipid II flippase)
MKRPFQQLGSVIAVTAGFTVAYMMSILAELPIPWVFTLLVAAMVATVWMVIRILKDPYFTDKSFDDYFYQDREDIRRNGKE